MSQSPLDPGDLAAIAEELAWLSGRSAPDGPMATLTGYAADLIRRAADTIAGYSCPLCGAGSARHWREEHARAIAAIRASYAEGLVDDADVIRLVAHADAEAQLRGVA
jgi:hypothetical protein